VNAIAAFFLRLWIAAKYFTRRLTALWPSRESKLYRYVRVDEFPDKLERAKVYLAGEGDNLWAAAMTCPCGCAEVIELNLLKQVRPCWSARAHADQTVSLKPSVWRQKGCRSHFYVRHGRIDWC
jgi:hypothetical protein